MQITIFTSNQPRHIALIERLATIGTKVFAVQECNTLFPGEVDDFFKKSPVMQDYFARVLAAEKAVFGLPRFLPGNVQAMPIKMGDLNRVPIEALDEAMSSDVVVVFGATFIKPPLIDLLVARRAINIHMGVSPWYRGSSTNFWAMYDRRPEYVGATIHLLSRGLDSGDVFFHAFPAPQEVDPFEYGMLAVKAAHEGLIDALRRGGLQSLAPSRQDKSLQLRYTRNADFTDEVASEYLARLPSPRAMNDELNRIDRSPFLRPFTLA